MAEEISYRIRKQCGSFGELRCTPALCSSGHPWATRGDGLLGALRVLAGCSTALAVFAVEDSNALLVPLTNRAMASCSRVAPFSSAIW